MQRCSGFCAKWTALCGDCSAPRRRRRRRRRLRDFADSEFEKTWKTIVGTDGKGNCLCTHLQITLVWVCASLFPSSSVFELVWKRVQEERGEKRGEKRRKWVHFAHCLSEGVISTDCLTESPLLFLGYTKSGGCLR